MELVKFAVTIGLRFLFKSEFVHMRCPKCNTVVRCPNCDVSEPKVEDININDWEFYTIRSSDLKALMEHRYEMMDMGFAVGVIRSDRYGVPEGWFTFSARIKKSCLTKKCFEKLVAWDKQFGEYDESEVDG